MSHLLDLSNEQRAHLSIAEADSARLNQLLRNVRTPGLSRHQWQVAACLASAVADQVQQVADLADTTAASRTWATTARLFRASAVRFELRAELADVAAEGTGMSSDAAHDAA